MKVKLIGGPAALYGMLTGQMPTVQNGAVNSNSVFIEADEDEIRKCGFACQLAAEDEEARPIAKKWLGQLQIDRRYDYAYVAKCLRIIKNSLDR